MHHINNHKSSTYERSKEMCILKKTCSKKKKYKFLSMNTMLKKSQIFYFKKGKEATSIHSCTNHFSALGSTALISVENWDGPFEIVNEKRLHRNRNPWKGIESRLPLPHSMISYAFHLKASKTAVDLLKMFAAEKRIEDETELAKDWKRRSEEKTREEKKERWNLMKYHKNHV